MCEILRGDAGKWSALAHLAALWNIPREAVVAIGDDHNDLPMIEGAGLGVAMAHAPSEVLERADCVLDTRPDALARFLHTLTN